MNAEDYLRDKAETYLERYVNLNTDLIACILIFGLSFFSGLLFLGADNAKMVIPMWYALGISGLFGIISIAIQFKRDKLKGSHDSIIKLLNTQHTKIA